jgi:hypothetical protein
MELMVGLEPLSIFDALATPMYDAFTTVPDNTPYNAIVPEQSLVELGTATAANADLSDALPFDHLDAVPQEISDQIIWQSVFGASSQVPAPGPNASRQQRELASAVRQAYAQKQDLRALLLGAGDDDD